MGLAAGPFVEAAPTTREEAVAMARDGKTEAAIAALRELLAAAPSDRLVAYDLAVILTWVGRNREATDAFEKAGGEEPPEYVLGPIIRAYRDQKRFAEAERWARAAQQRYPLDASWAKLLGLVLADQGKTKEARALLEPWAAKQPDDAEIWLALGYASLRSRDRFGTLRAYGQALRFQPENREAMAAMAGVLAELGAPTAAARYQQPVPIAVQANQAGELVRWGHEVTPRDPRRRFEGTDKALARLDQLLAQARAARKPDKGLIIRLRRDRVLALRNRERWLEAVRETEALRAEGDTIPPYVREAEADALLALRRPRGGAARLRGSATRRARTAERRSGASSRWSKRKISPPRFSRSIRSSRSKSPACGAETARMQPNDKWLEAKVLSAQARSFADMPGAAWKRMLPLAEHAPANAELRRVLGDIAGGRGWPRRSAEEIEIAASLAPEDKAAQVALAESAIRRRHWKEARSRAAELAAIYPNDVHVRRLQTDLRAHDAFELQTEFHVNKEYGGKATTRMRPAIRRAPGPTGRRASTRRRWRNTGASSAHGSTTRRRSRKAARCGIASAPASSWRFRISPSRRSAGATKATSRSPARASPWRGCRPTTGASISARNTSRATRRCAPC